MLFRSLSTMRALVDRGLSLLLVEQNVRATLELVDELYLLERGRAAMRGRFYLCAGRRTKRSV